MKEPNNGYNNNIIDHDNDNKNNSNCNYNLQLLLSFKAHMILL